MQLQLTPADRSGRCVHGASRPLLVAIVSVLWLMTGIGGLVPDTPGIAHAQTTYPDWMRDSAPVIGQRPLRQVVIPGSHDAATYDGWGNQVTLGLAQAQSLNPPDQLNAGSRWFDLRFRLYDWGGGGCSPDCRDYWNYHGQAVNSVVRMGDVLAAVVEWSTQHPQEILMLSIDVAPQFAGDQTLLNQICSATLGSAVTAGLVLQPSMLPPGMTLWDLTMNEIWALPGQPRIITNWAGCTGERWSNPDPAKAPWPFATRYADRCLDFYLDPGQSRFILEALTPSLEARTDDNGQLVDGIYTLFVQGTPEQSDCGTIPPRITDLAPLQGPVLTAITGWRQQNQHNALANLNVLAGDFIGACTQDPINGTHCADSEWPIVQTALNLNHTAPAPQLAGEEAIDGVRVSCTNPAQPGLQMIAYARGDGPHTRDAVRVQGGSSGQLDLARSQFPAGDLFDDVRVDCTTAINGMTSGLAISPASLPGKGCPYRVGTFIVDQDSGEIDVTVPGCQRRQVLDGATIDRMLDTWGGPPLRVVDPADFNNVAQGPNIPDYTTRPHDFMLAMEDIYGAPCSSFLLTSNLKVGALVQNAGQDAIYVLAGGCQLRHIPNPTTMQQIQAITNQPTWRTVKDFPVQQFVNGPNIPDVTTSKAAFGQAMLEIYGESDTEPVACGRGAICHVELSRVHAKGPRVIATGSIAPGPCPPRDNCLEFRGEDEVVVAGSLWGAPRRDVVSVRLTVVNATDLSVSTPIVVCGQSNGAGQVSCGGFVPDAFPRLGGDVDVLAQR